jgi:hypothetical protein
MEKDAQAVLKGAIEGFGPNLIGISVRNIDDQNREHPRFLLDPVKEIVVVCRRFSEARIVLGGAGYSIFPEATLSYLGADMGIQGEGEVIFPALIERIEQGAGLQDMPGLYLPSVAFRVKECSRKIWAKCLSPVPST